MNKKFLLLLSLLGAALSHALPRVSIITSVYKGREFIEGFLADITRQTIFKDCELIIINADSPENEEPIILRYCAEFPNIIYVRLDSDPGLYAVWNLAIKMSHAPYITNANVDDRRNPEVLAIHAQALDEHPEIDLVYSGVLVTYEPNQTYENNTYRWVIETIDFAPNVMYKCLPGPMPMWRKSMHERFGYFREDFSSSADWEFWVRGVSKGASYLRIPMMAGLWYVNPHGLSTDPDEAKSRKRSEEDQWIVNTYCSLWQ